MADGKFQQDAAFLQEMAQDAAVPLYAIYTKMNAAKLLTISEKELTLLCNEKKITCLIVGQNTQLFFGRHLLEYLLECAIPAQPPQTITEPAGQPATAIHPKAVMVSVQEALKLIGISRTKLYQLLNQNQIKFIKIGSRTLINRTSLNEFLDGNSL